MVSEQEANRIRKLGWRRKREKCLGECANFPTGLLFFTLIDSFNEQTDCASSLNKRGPQHELTRAEKLEIKHKEFYVKLCSFLSIQPT